MMHKKIQDEWSNMSNTPIGTVIDIGNILWEFIKETRYESEMTVKECGFYIYRHKVSKELRCDRYEVGSKARITMNIDEALRAKKPGEDLVGSCHSHPYFWKLSKKAAIGPASGDTNAWTNEQRECENYRIHFVIANWRLFALVYPPKFSNPDNVRDDTPSYSIYEHWENRTTQWKEKQKDDRERFNARPSLIRRFYKKPVITRSPYPNPYNLFQKEYQDPVSTYGECESEAATNAERALYKKYKHGSNGIKFNRAESWTMNSYNYLIDYCSFTNIPLYIGQIDSQHTKIGTRHREEHGAPQIANIAPNKIVRVPLRHIKFWNQDPSQIR